MHTTKNDIADKAVAGATATATARSAVVQAHDTFEKEFLKFVSDATPGGGEKAARGGGAVAARTVIDPLGVEDFFCIAARAARPAMAPS